MFSPKSSEFFLRIRSSSAVENQPALYSGHLRLTNKGFRSHNLAKNFLGSTGEISHSKAFIPSASVSASAPSLRQPGTLDNSGAKDGFSNSSFAAGTKAEEEDFFKMPFGEVEDDRCCCCFCCRCCCCCCWRGFPAVFSSFSPCSLDRIPSFFRCFFAVFFDLDASTMESIFSGVIITRLC